MIAVTLPAPLDPDDEWAIVMAMAADGEEAPTGASDLDWREIEEMAGINIEHDPSGEWAGGRHG